MSWLTGSYRSPSQVSASGVYFFDCVGATGWDSIRHGWIINRPQHRDDAGNPTIWERCEKEARP
jgi:hypothetical protein